MEIIKQSAAEFTLIFFQIMDAITTKIALMQVGLGERNFFFYLLGEGGFFILKIVITLILLVIMMGFDWGESNKWKWLPVTMIGLVVVNNIYFILSVVFTA